MGLGGEYAGHLVEPVGDHGRHVLVAAYSHHRYEVDLSGDRIDITHSIDGRDLLGDLGNPGDVSLHEHDGGDHESTLADRGPPVARCDSISECSPRKRSP